MSDKKIVQDIEDSVNRVLASESRNIRLRYAMGDEITAEETASNLLSSVAIDLLKTKLQGELCAMGHVQSLTCKDSSEPGKMDFLVGYNGKRFTLGFSVDF